MSDPQRTIRIANDLEKVLAALAYDPAKRTFTELDYFAQEQTFKHPHEAITAAVSELRRLHAEQRIEAHRSTR